MRTTSPGLRWPIGNGWAAALWWAAGLAILAATLAFLALTLGAHALLRARERRRKALAARWGPLFVASLDGTPAFPPLAPRDVPPVLALWNYYHDSMRGEAKEALNRAARAAGLDKAALRLLAGNRTAERLLAVVTLGHLRERAAWEALEHLAYSRHTALSLAAARSLVRIDPAAAMLPVIPFVASRRDWPVDRVAAVLKETDPAAFTLSLSAAAAMAPPDQACRLLKLVLAAGNASALPAVRGILAEKDDPEVAAACLQILGRFAEPADRLLVRGFLAHPQWFVRLRAIQALSRLATPEDEKDLVAALSDREWWVRYRAAQALADLPDMPPRRLAAVRDRLADPFARDIVAQVLSEMKEPA